MGLFRQSSRRQARELQRLKKERMREEDKAKLVQAKEKEIKRISKARAARRGGPVRGIAQSFGFESFAPQKEIGKKEIKRKGRRSVAQRKKSFSRPPGGFRLY